MMLKFNIATVNVWIDALISVSKTFIEHTCANFQAPYHKRYRKALMDKQNLNGTSFMI